MRYFTLINTESPLRKTLLFLAFQW
jgi:hypothetical protein